MARRLCGLAYFGLATFMIPSMGAQTTAARPAPRCYRLTVGDWSRPLGVNARYHALPVEVRLDTVRVGSVGSTAAPDIDFPTGKHYPGTPLWTRKADTIEIVWSNGFQGTRVRVGASGDDELRGTVSVWSDANEFGTEPPHASVVAQRLSCAGVP